MSIAVDFAGSTILHKVYVDADDRSINMKHSHRHPFSRGETQIPHVYVNGLARIPLLFPHR